MESFSIGRTLSRTFGLARSSLRGVGIFLLLVQILSGVMQFFSQRAVVETVTVAQAGTTTNPALAMFSSGWYWVALLASVALGSFAFGGSIHGLLETDDGRTATLADCVRVGLAKLLPVLGLTILWSLGVGAGWLLVLVPGLFLMTMWSVCMPALIGENLGVIASFGRSRHLTKGSRLKIFVTLLVVMILVYVVLFGALGAILGGGLASLAGGLAYTSPWMTLLTIVFGWLSSMVTSALLVAIYQETVTIRGGATSTKLDEIFS